ncbi:hypothetical protein DNTS_024807 [Danionella cerebrum]|uniref:UBA domain-containing protein n=1 Tax=Danionella cerebrum TaxID=2873325 RepID=A0A553QRX6_9TELE|nr:hypothetical protein DNTS_024807 [Danionella translucida]
MEDEVKPLMFFLCVLMIFECLNEFGFHKTIPSTQKENILCTPTSQNSYERLSHSGPTLPAAFSAPLLFPEGLSSIETLLTNIQGLLKVAVDNARAQEKQVQLERSELKMELYRERELRETLERELCAEQKNRALIQKRLKKEKKNKRKLQEALEVEARRRDQAEQSLQRTTSCDRSPSQNETPQKEMEKNLNSSRTDTDRTVQVYYLDMESMLACRYFCPVYLEHNNKEFFLKLYTGDGSEYDSLVLCVVVEEHHHLTAYGAQCNLRMKFSNRGFVVSSTLKRERLMDNENGRKETSKEGEEKRGREEANCHLLCGSGMMFTSTGSWGLYKAPVSKSLLLLPTALTVLLTVLLPQYQEIFIYNLESVRNDKQIWRLLSGRLICLDLKDTFCSSLLFYNFRIFERRFGSRKFASFLFGAWILSAFVDLLLTEALLGLFELKVEVLPAGLLAPAFALFVPFYSSIPRVQITQLLGHFSITNKSLTYIVGAQLMTSSAYMWVVACSGLMAGFLYYSNKVAVQKLLHVPRWLARCSAMLLEPIFSESEPTAEAPLGMGATLDIQRQQRMDILDQQLLLSQLTQLRRNTQQQNAQPGILNWNRFFPSLRHRGHQHDAPQAQQANRTHPAEQPDHPAVPEAQVALLMEMGFSRMDAQEALRASNNDINIATNFLLQH